jgi:hypothetical protein
MSTYPSIYDGGISPGQKWWQTVLKIEISCSQWEGSECNSKCLFFFFFLSFKFLMGEDFFFHFSFVPITFSSCSQWVPIMFSIHSLSSQICSPRVFPIAAHFHPICFAQSPPLLTQIGGPKGVRIPSFHRIFYFGEAP